MGELVRKSGVFSLLSGLVLMLGAACASAVEFAGGTGTVVDPYQIATGSQLIAVGSDPSLYDKHFVLSNDVDLDPNKPSGKVFIRAVIAANLTPDGSQSHEFTGPIFAGSFDGSGHAIRNLTIRTGTGHYLGLFGKTGSNAVLCNLTLESVRVSISGSNVGGLVGYNRGCVVNCRISGTISGGIGEYCTWVGLLAGENSGRISDCVVNGSVEAGTGKSGWDITTAQPSVVAPRDRSAAKENSMRSAA